MEDQVMEITSFSSKLKEKEVLQKERIEAHDTVVESRKANDTKRLQVLEQRLELDEEHVSSDKKSLEDDRANLDEKIKAETSTFDDEKGIWDTQRNDVQLEIDLLTEQLQKKQREMETIMSKINENEKGIQTVMEIYLPRNKELDARKKALEEKEESCNVQRLRIQEIKDSIDNSMENSNLEKNNLIQSLHEVQSNQKFVEIASETLKEVGVLRASITKIVNESSQCKSKMIVEIDLAKQSFSVAKAQEEELEAKVEEFRNKLSIIDERLPALNGEKKRAIQAKNFKAAGRVTGEIKKFTADREVVAKEMDQANEQLNESVSLSNELQDKVKTKEEESLKKGKEYDFQRLEIEKNQRQLINKALRKFKKISKKFGLNATSSGGNKSNPSKDLLMISLNASQVEIGKLCLKYHLDDIVEEEEEEEEEEVEEEEEEEEEGNVDDQEKKKDVVDDGNNEHDDNDNSENNDNVNNEESNGFGFMQANENTEEKEEATSNNDANNVDKSENDVSAIDATKKEEEEGEEQAQEEEVDLEQVRLEKLKRIEELEALVEQAVAEDDFEQAELYQNEIDTLKSDT